MPGGPKLLVIACGAIARELVRIRELNGWDHVEFQCLPAELHNRPEQIPGAVRGKIETQTDRYDGVFVAYADCGTGGLLDKALAGTGIERIPGAHCYEFFAGGDVFHDLNRTTQTQTPYNIGHGRQKSRRFREVLRA